MLYFPLNSYIKIQNNYYPFVSVNAPLLLTIMHKICREVHYLCTHFNSKILNKSITGKIKLHPSSTF